MTSIIPINEANIDLSLIEKINIAADLPEKRILLYLSRGQLPDGESYLGVCLPRKLIEYAPSYRKYDKDDRYSRWDCFIGLSKKTCDYSNTHPAYFAYLLAHEFGHALVCFDDLPFHIFNWLVENYINEASGGKVSKWWQIPHEIQHDRFGIHISSKIYGRDILNEQIRDIIAKNDSKDIRRLEIILEMEGSADYSDIKRNFVEFVLPYKSELIRLWEREKEEASKHKRKSLTEIISNYEQLFKV